jgi:hypothetical protein
MSMRPFLLSIMAVTVVLVGPLPASALDCDAFKQIALQSKDGFVARRQIPEVVPTYGTVFEWNAEKLEGNKCSVKEYKDKFYYGCFTDDGPSQGWEDFAAGEVETAMTCFGSTAKNLRIGLDEEDDEYIIKETTLTVSKEFSILWSVFKGRENDATSFLYVTFKGMKSR